MKPFLFRSPILPEGFRFPLEYEGLVESTDLPDLSPWRFLASDMPSSLEHYATMLLKFPDSPLVPFAMISDATGFYNDGYVVLACFDGTDTSGHPRVRIYDYGSPKRSPWENLSYASFNEWIAAAQQESSRYKAELAESGDTE